MQPHHFTREYWAPGVLSVGGVDYSSHPSPTCPAKCAALPSGNFLCHLTPSDPS